MQTPRVLLQTFARLSSRVSPILDVEHNARAAVATLASSLPKMLAADLRRRCFSTTGSSPAEEDSNRIIPEAERCKSLLTANWRAQLTTVNVAAATEQTQAHSEVYGSLVHYTMIDSSPVIALTLNDRHQVKLVMAFKEVHMCEVHMCASRRRKI